MFVCYEWIVVMWIIAVSLASVIVGLLLLTCPLNRHEIDALRFSRFILAIFASTQATTAVYLACDTI